MSSNNPKTVLLSGDPVQYEGQVKAESKVTPGHFLIYDDGTVDAGAAKVARIARERDYIGKGIDEEIGAGENVPFYVGRQGDRFYCWLKDGETVSEGDRLQADEDGLLVAHVEGDTTEDGGNVTSVTFPGDAVVVAREDKAASGDNARIRVEVI